MSKVAIQRASSPSTLTTFRDYMNQVYDKVAQRAFSLFERDGWPHGHDLEHWLKAETEFLSAVPFELSETRREGSGGGSRTGPSVYKGEVRKEGRRNEQENDLFRDLFQRDLSQHQSTCGDRSREGDRRAQQRRSGHLAGESEPGKESACHGKGCLSIREADGTQNPLPRLIQIEEQRRDLRFVEFR